MNKKAQGISLNVIIIASIALIVLVVLIAIFAGRLGIFVGGLSDTEARAEQSALRFEYGSQCVPKISVLKGIYSDADLDNDGNLNSDEESEYESAKSDVSQSCANNVKEDCDMDCTWIVA